MSYIICEDLILGYEGTLVAEHISFRLRAATTCVSWGRTAREKVR